MTVTRADFRRVVDDTWNRLNSLSTTKGAEYSGPGDNQLANFEDVARELGVTREVVLLVYLEKHMRSIKHAIAGHGPQSESIDGRIMDAIVYLVLLRCMADDGRTEPNDPFQVDLSATRWICRKCGIDHPRQQEGLRFSCIKGGFCEEAPPAPTPGAV